MVWSTHARRELDVSCNKLKELPPEIGKCSRLRKLAASANYLEEIPEELGRCALLEVCEPTSSSKDEARISETRPSLRIHAVNEVRARIFS